MGSGDTRGAPTLFGEAAIGLIGFDFKAMG